MANKAYLVLEDGRTFEGTAFGAAACSIGELVFTTGMCGYLETLSDPSYYGQIVLQTFPLIGNYGVIPEDFEGECHLRGYVVREWCAHPSNFRASGDLDAWLKEKGIPGIAGIDTRALTRIIREQGVMNAMICAAPPSDLSAVRNYRITGAVEATTVRAAQVYPPIERERCRVTLIDYGAKHNIIRELQKRGARVTVVPAVYSAKEILATHPDGLMLSNGPGDPADCAFQIETLRALLGKRPIFGICLGHQLLALAAGGKTVKLKYGHRGVNQPVKEKHGARTYITSQNHGYAVLADSVPKGEPCFYNANDQTCEGMIYPEEHAFSVQFHPEACAGPRDCAFLFDRFFAEMGVSGYAAESVD
ncbi:MAG: carbamoyl phosphate synthase small subunit [Clostridiales bacterium]|nr:MAG: carbamoyl phosphate synthase small subunit [Clostridiales bacterium]